MEDSPDMKRTAVFILIAGLAAAVGFGLAFGVIGLWSSVQGPFLPEWDDTWHERIPVGLAYLTWGASIVAGLIVAWRVSRRSQRS
jgi:hypothetical protein